MDSKSQINRPPWLRKTKKRHSKLSMKKEKKKGFSKAEKESRNRFWEVERIEEIRQFEGSPNAPSHFEFLLKWRGFSAAKNSWQKEEDFKSSKTVIEFLNEFIQRPNLTQQKNGQKKLAHQAIFNILKKEKKQKEKGEVGEKFRSDFETGTSLCISFFDEQNQSESEINMSCLNESQSLLVHRVSQNEMAYPQKICMFPSFTCNSGQNTPIKDYDSEELENLKTWEEEKIEKISSDGSQVFCEVLSEGQMVNVSLEKLKENHPGLFGEAETLLAKCLWLFKNALPKNLNS